MELSDQEQAVLEDYLKSTRGSTSIWKVILVLGALVCASSVLMLLISDVVLSFALLFLVTGLVAVARALDQRNRVLVGQIIHKYDEALEELKAELAQDR